MREQITQSESKDWAKVGSGHAFTFYATLRDISFIIENNLPMKYAPYRIEFVVQQNGEFFYESILPSDLCMKHEYYGKHFEDFYLRSMVLTPILSPDISENITLRRNCLIGIREAIPGMEYMFPPQIAVIEKWANAYGEIFERKEYLTLFNILKRIIKAILQYTIIDFMTGIETTDAMVSENYYQEILLGKVKGINVMRKLK